MTFVAKGGILLYDNKILARSKEKMKFRVKEIFKYLGKDDGSAQVTILLKELLEIKAS